MHKSANQKAAALAVQLFRGHYTSAQARMAQLADFLKQFPDRRVSIEGHTEIGSTNYNMELSLRRAEAIKSQLVGLGIASERISTVGYGKDFPVAANDTDTNRAINRRVEVVIRSRDRQSVPAASGCGGLHVQVHGDHHRITGILAGLGQHRERIARPGDRAIVRSSVK